MRSKILPICFILDLKLCKCSNVSVESMGLYSNEKGDKYAFEKQS